MLEEKELKVLSYSPQDCPVSMAYDLDLIINLCTEGVNHKKHHGIQTHIKNIEIAAACANLASASKGKKLLHVGSYHEMRLSEHTKKIASCLSSQASLPLLPIDDYAFSKSIQTIILSSLSAACGIESLVVMAPNVYGPPNPAKSLAGHLDEVANQRQTLKLRQPNAIITSVDIQTFVNLLIQQAKLLVSSPHTPQCIVTSIPGEISTVAQFVSMYLKDK